MNDLKNKITIQRYGFLINFDIDRKYSGFYWKAISNKTHVTGFIDYSLFSKNSEIFIETPFTPREVECVPKFAMSKSLAIEPSLILSGDWLLSFTILKESSATIQILGAEQQSYGGQILVPSVSLKEITTQHINLKTIDVFDKLFFKKSNYSEQEIILSNFSLFRKKNNQMLVSDESLIKPEYENISRKDNKIVFDSKAPIWSFFSMQFYEI